MNKKELRKKVFDKCDGKCAYCGEELPKRWHVDHMEPVERVSKYVKGKGLIPTGEMNYPERDTFENMLPSCPSCNIQKHSMTIEYFRLTLERKIDVLNYNSNPYKIAKKFGLLKETPKKIVFYFERMKNENL